MNRTIDDVVLDSIWKDLTHEERDVIDHKPKLNLKAYKNLVEQGGVGLLHKAITEKEGMPTLSVKFVDIL